MYDSNGFVSCSTHVLGVQLQLVFLVIWLDVLLREEDRTFIFTLVSFANLIHVIKTVLSN